MKKIIKWWRRRQTRKMIKATIKVLKALDRTMIKAGYSRQQRREIWRKLPTSRDDILKCFERTLKDV